MSTESETRTIFSSDEESEIESGSESESDTEDSENSIDDRLTQIPRLITSWVAWGLVMVRWILVAQLLYILFLGVASLTGYSAVGFPFISVSTLIGVTCLFYITVDALFLP